MKSYNQDHSSPSPEISLENISTNLYTKFKKCTLFYGRFHLFFISFLCLQLFSFLLFFSHFSKLAISACALAIFFLTLFSYLVLIFFFQAKKSQQLLSLREDFFHLCQKLYHPTSPSKSIHLELAKAAETTTSFLNQQEEVFYSSGSLFGAIAPLFEKLRIRLHWKNFHTIKELLLLLSIEELIALIKCIPTNIEAHAKLAEAYIKLSLIYIHPSKIQEQPTLFWIPPEYTSEEMQNKFTSCAERAIEEFKILQDYNSSSPWIHAKLSEIYHLQEKPEEEILQYEELLKMVPDDHEALFRLGVLYFEQGHNAKGLKIYENLQQNLPKKAEALIEYYDSYPFHDLSYLSSL